MKTPLSYQRSEYDCGPTALLNAISFLFDRKQIAPDLIKFVQYCCLDGFNHKGEIGKSGTSPIAMSFLCNWLNQYREMRRLPIRCEWLRQEEICISEHCRIVDWLRSGGCAVLRVYLGCGHYVLLTGVEANKICLFDPYFREKPYRLKSIEMVYDAPDRMNRKVSFELFNLGGRHSYSLEKVEQRECLLLCNTATWRGEAE